MAGESPDRSKQRESSAGPTSGSASPVPEARGEVRDPRLAVTRESEASPPASSAPRRNPDTATQVFSFRTLTADKETTETTETAETAEEAEEPAEEPESTAQPDTEGTEAGKDGRQPSGAEDSAEGTAREDSASTGGGETDATEATDATDEARLRAAVTAWVTTADEKTAERGEKAAEDDASGESDDEPEPADGGDGDGDKAADAEEEDGTDPEAADPPGDAGGDDDSAAAEAEAEPEADSGSETHDEPEPDDEPETEPEPDDEPKSAAGGNGARAVDHPTAVFKAVRPAKPAVDQPTTMLKLGGAAEAPEDKALQDKAPQPAEAERTSRFVALKPLDDASTRRPMPADATAVVPQVGPELTVQQPLPPKPPLDLLAELTNTPPPPPTPLRTLTRRIRIWTPLVLLLVIVFAIAQSVRALPATALTLTAEDSYTFDGTEVDLPWPSEGQGWMDVNGVGTMDTFGKQTPVAIGSVAKAMTAYIVLKDHPLKSGEEGPSITVDATAEKEGGYDKDGESTLNTVKENDELTEKQALSAIMIPSANNIARLLARWDAGSEAAFIKKMNDTAKELGMTNTTYTDASGLKETTVSTAEDQVKLGNELVKIRALMDITKLPEWIDPSGTRHRNYNTLVPYDNALGIKTGSTTKAGGNLLFAATKEVGGETVTLVGAVLGQHTSPIIDTVNAVSKTAMLAAQDEMASAKILKKGDVVGYVDDGLGHHTPVVATKDVTAVGWAGLKVKLSFETDVVPHAAAAGTKVGTLTVGDGTNGAVQVPVALEKELVEPSFTDKLTRLA